MKRLLKAFSAAVLAALMTAFCVTPAFAAASVSTGDTVVVSVSIENEDAMGSTTIQIDYDSNMFDFLSDEKRTQIATGATNSQTAGQVLWVAVFDPEGADYTEKTEVYRCLLVAKQDIANIDGLISFQVNDAYRIGAEGIEKADPAKLSCSIFPEGFEPQDDNNSEQNVDSSSQTNSENTASDRTEAPSKPAVTSSNSNSSKAAFGSSSNSASSSTSSKSKDTDKSASPSNSKSTDADNKNTDKIISAKSSDTDTSAADTEETEELAQGFTEKDFENVPPIKTETEDTVSRSTSSKGKFPLWAKIGTVVGVVLAAAGIIIKKREQGK